MKAVLKVELEVNNDSEEYITNLCKYVKRTFESQLETDECAELIKDDWECNVEVLKVLQNK